MKSDVEVLVDSFTVSYSFDLYPGKGKASNFVSMGFKLSKPVTPQEALLLEAQHSDIVTSAVIYNALARNLLTKEEANEMLTLSRERHAGVAKALAMKMESHGTNE